ncbi:hypothetical protein HQ45_04680 [Porphyromonas crevioricanis]|uniref:SPOR domain-containing protein n=1 Tax=Porphyromonas crevioricanis TaxID=393921 RepID=A0AB34PEL6_9PORP|nr:hypothetical protein HQ45_04680 [Porphyromonas crevioricanis]KGN93139.1 hypothetical protein HQ38_09535 [Porphyromonas crevioricanis]
MLTALLLWIPKTTYAQNVVTNDQSTAPASIFEALESSKPGEGRVIVFVPSEVRKRVGTVGPQGGQILHGETNISLRGGFRIQVYVGNLKTSKQEAYSRASRVNRLFPGEVCYVTYKAPFWKLLVGDFISHEEAHKVAKELKQSMPDLAQEIYVVRNRIRYHN